MDGPASFLNAAYNQNPLHCVAVTGGSGFVGQNLLSHLARRQDLSLRALSHSNPETRLAQSARLQWIRGDLAAVATLTTLLVPDSIFINLAFPFHWSYDSHLAATENLARAVVRQRVRRVIHCSTAVVIGQSTEDNVTETTRARPKTEYERIKLAIEETWRRYAGNSFELVIVRPTAVFGPHGKNLIKLADALITGNQVTNYLRSSLLAHRKMNLLCVSNLISALEFLIDSETRFEGTTFIVSDDDENGNNFRDVERTLMRGLGVRDYAVPPLRVPPFALSTFMRLLAPEKASPLRTYDNALLKQAGWRKPCGLEQGLREFAAWYAATYVRTGAKAG